jgi:hypothetical protein
MREVRRTGTAAGVAAMVALVWAVSGGSPVSATVEPSDSTPSTEAPSEPPPDGTAPPADDTTPDDTLVAAGEPDSDIAGTVAAIAVVGFVLLVGVAAWWMVRRSNPDAGPKPPVPPSGPPPSDLI